MSDEEAVRHIAHLVMLDRHWPSAFVTASRQKADTAVNLLAEAFGYDRVSMMSVGEGEFIYEMDVNPTAENIAKLICLEGRNRQLPLVAVRLWETPTSYAEYRIDLPKA